MHNNHTAEVHMWVMLSIEALFRSKVNGMILEAEVAGTSRRK